VPYSIGIDIGGTYVRVGMIASDGAILFALKEKVTDQRTPKGLVHQLCTLYDRLPLTEKPWGIGIGVPGPVKPHTGYVYVFPNLRIAPFDLAMAMEAKLSIPTLVMNDANVAAFGEARIGAGQGYRSVQFVTISTGVGGGFVVDGQLWTGQHGFAQEVGNMIIQPNGIRPNPSMNPGCWETYCSGTSLVRFAHEAGVEVQHAGQVFSTPSLASIIDQWIDHMAMALANMVTLYEPDVFVLGGGVMQSQDFFLDKLRLKMNDYLLPGLKGKILIFPALLNQDAGLIGAGLLPFYLK
jgi:glucokinase